MIPVHDLEDARQAIRKIAASQNASVSALSDASDLSRGVVNRFVSNTRKTEGGVTDIRLSSLLRLINFAGWEIVIRPRDNRPRRTRIREAARGANGDAEA